MLLLLFPVVEGSSSEDNGDDEDVLDMNTKGNVNVNVPFCMCGGSVTPEPGSAVDDDDDDVVADGGCGGGISACAVMMLVVENK